MRSSFAYHMALAEAVTVGRLTSEEELAALAWLDGGMSESPIGWDLELYFQCRVKAAYLFSATEVNLSHLEELI